MNEIAVLLSLLHILSSKINVCNPTNFNFSLNIPNY